jgi:FkbM family methyltransferase
MADVTTLEIPCGVRVVVPNSLNLITPYVLYEQGDWFEDEIRFLRHALLPGQNVIDVGANYGVYALSIAARVGQAGRVWAFEPTSSTASLLARSIAANGFQHVELVTCAVSSECGQAQLALNDNSELNALTRGNAAGGSVETVNVVTLDDCMRQYAWNNIAFLKIDAEGEEANIIAGARKFLATNSPLVMFEIKAGVDLHMELVDKFADCGYRSYRLVAGLQLLVPFEANAAPDGYLLNVFCCKDDTADSLTKRGLLLSAKSLNAFDASLRLQQFLRDRSSSYQWQQKLAALPYGAALARLWEVAPKSAEMSAAGAALACFAISRDETLEPLLRYRALETSQRALQELCEHHPQFLRLASLARVSRDYGARSVAVTALGRLVDMIAKVKQVPVEEPFLCPSSRLETIPPRDDVGKWALASILEELELLSFFSSFYNVNAASPRLEVIASLGYADAEMNRRLQLLKLRFPTNK